MRGNPCELQISEETASREPLTGISTGCRSWPLAAQRAGVQCWTAEGSAIDCCGHGLLCAASYWASKWSSGGVLVYNHSELPARCSGTGAAKRYWVAFEQPALTSVTAPSDLSSLLGAVPQDCANVGDENGYLIAALGDDSDLSALEPPGNALSQLTSRALIVTSRPATAPRRHNDTDPDFYYRYFAPQYGVEEDAATGSAMRLLAHFWQTRGLGESLTARQCSPQGGLLHSKIEGTLTWVGGRVGGRVAGRDVVRERDDISDE